MAKILLVDDNKELADIICNLLVKIDKQSVDIAHEGQAALQLLTLNEYDLLILDWSMPGTIQCHSPRSKSLRYRT